ncbi:tyrosine-type recombinase/integrase [Dyella silvatica]|uniref:tyrosine-type recombinase/integrase n=1 Tax=Dyella silvatica TaxID=2992128 RepID=UPI0022588A72|nr:site-specific integrase [Dyella silvatica]
MTVYLKGKLKPGEVDRRYYMIRVQRKTRRVVASSNTRDKALALRKEEEIVKLLDNNPDIPKADIIAAITGNGSHRHKAAVRAAGGLTLKEAFDRCLKSPTVWKDIKAHSEYARNCRVIEEILGADTPLASIDYHAIADLTAKLVTRPAPGKGNTQKKVSGATVNNHLACIRRMFNVALDERWPDAPTAFPKVKTVKKRLGRGYFMDSWDEKSIFDAVLELDTLNPGIKGGPPRKRDARRYHLLYQVLVESGLRLGEALGLLWTELDFPRGKRAGMIELFRHEDLKTGRQRSVPMTETCCQALKACEGIEDGPFKDLNDRRAQDIWARARKAAKIAHRDCVVHCLRHTCASRLIESGVDLKIVKEWLGHSSIATTDIYTHLQTKQLSKAALSMQQLREDSTERL